MTYHCGDCVYPADLPRRYLCRVAMAERIDLQPGAFQMLTLEPLEGPWGPGTLLMRDDSAVRPARAPRVARRQRNRREAIGTGATFDGEAA
jgi:hypothetical protein